MARTITESAMTPPVDEKYADEALVYAFDYDAVTLAADVELTTSGTFTIDPADGRLTKDNEALMIGNRKARVRLSGGKPGKTYTIRHSATTNESPAQTVQAQFSLFIRLGL